MVKKRCVCCNKKVGYIGFQCRCLDDDYQPNIFCSSCRVPRMNSCDKGHNCNFDYKELGRQQLAKNAHAIVAVKIESI